MTLGGNGVAYGITYDGGYYGYGDLFSLNIGASFLSQPVAAPNPALVSQPVQFMAVAGDGSGDMLAYAWDFGDGVAGTGGTTTHTYTAANTYSAKLTVTDVSAPSTPVVLSATIAVVVNQGGLPASPFTISNSDGIPDQMASVASSLGISAAGAPEQLPDVSLAIKLNFAKTTGNDSISSSGTLVLPANFTATNVPIVFDIGGVVQGFTLNATAKVKSGNNSFALALKKSSVAASSKFALKLTKGTFAVDPGRRGLNQRDHRQGWRQGDDSGRYHPQ